MHRRGADRGARSRSEEDRVPDPPGCSPAAEVRPEATRRGGIGNNSPTAALGRPGSPCRLRPRVPATTSRTWSTPASRHLSMIRRVCAWKSWILVSASAGRRRSARRRRSPCDHPRPDARMDHPSTGSGTSVRSVRFGMQPRSKPVEQRQLGGVAQSGIGPRMSAHADDPGRRPPRCRRELATTETFAWTARSIRSDLRVRRSRLRGLRPRRLKPADTPSRPDVRIPSRRRDHVERSAHRGPQLVPWSPCMRRFWRYRRVTRD